jgi:hypothetical protein
MLSLAPRSIVSLALLLTVATPGAAVRDPDAAAIAPCAHQPHGGAPGWARRCLAVIGGSSGVAKGDFNGDGVADLAIGVPAEDIGTVLSAGAVNVIYGSDASGLGATGNQIWYRGAGGLPGIPGFNERLGRALAAGDFNRDGYSDLAIATNQLTIIYGSTVGLHASLRAPLQNLQAYEPFTMTWGDFNGDGYGDLAYGQSLYCTTFYTSHTKGCSYRIRVHPGSAHGLTDFILDILELQVNITLPNSGFFQDLAMLPLLAADFNHDGYADLAFAGRRYDTNDAAVTCVVRGTSSGLRLAMTGCDFPYGSLAAGDLNGDSYPELVIGAPNDTVSGAAEAGQVRVYSGSSAGPTSGGALLIRQDLAEREAGDHFGASLAVADFDLDGFRDLAVGAPDEDIFVLVGGSMASAEDAGSVMIFPGSATGPTSIGRQYWYQSGAGVEGDSETGDRFGYGLSAWNFGRLGYPDLAIAVPFEDISGRAEAGAVNVLYGSALGLTTTGNQIWHQGSPDIGGDPEAGDYFGWALY